MKKIGVLVLALSMVIMMFSGCGENTETDSEIQKLKVYTSFYPMYDFTVKIAGDMADVVNLVPAGGEPHHWEPSSYDIVNLENADMFIYSGAGMEHWTEKVLNMLSNKDMIVVEASEGLTLIEGKHNHSHDEDHDHEHEHDHDEDHDEDHEHEHDANMDPHVWLSIKNAKAQMERIKNAFVLADAENADYYEGNFRKYAAEFDALDKEFAETISKLPNKNLVVTHAAFGYLCHDYGLNQIAVQGLTPDSEPDPARMVEIIKFVKENNVKVIFFEELLSPNVANTIANATGAEVGVLNPIEGLSNDQLANGSDYFSVMKENLEAIKKALY